jgi:hypothetical protein
MRGNERRVGQIGLRARNSGFETIHRPADLRIFIARGRRLDLAFTLE